MTTTTKQTLTGSNRSDVIQQISEMLGSEGSREMATRMYDALGGSYSSDQRAVVVTYTEAQWAALLTSTGPEAMAADEAAAHLDQGICWKTSDGLSDEALGLGEAWGGGPTGYGQVKWNVLCEAAVRRIAAERVTECKAAIDWSDDSAGATVSATDGGVTSYAEVPRYMGLADVAEDYLAAYDLRDVEEAGEVTATIWRLDSEGQPVAGSKTTAARRHNAAGKWLP